MFTKSQKRGSCNGNLPVKDAKGRGCAEGSRKAKKGRSLLLNLRCVIPLPPVPRSDPSNSYDYPLLCYFNCPFFRRGRREETGHAKAAADESASCKLRKSCPGERFSPTPAFGNCFLIVLGGRKKYKIYPYQN